MPTQPLFLDRPLSFEQEKYAGLLTPLGDNADRWPLEIMDAAYEQLPYLSDFDVHAIMDQADEERGYGFGSLEVRPRLHEPTLLNDSKPKTVQIPFIIREKRMAPLDIFVDGNAYYHLTEGRLRAALFQPQAFDAIRERPAEPSLYADLQPPSEGFGSAKLASLSIGVPLLPQLHGRALPRHIDRLKTAMQDPSLQATIANGTLGVAAAFASAVQLEPSDPVKTAEAIWRNTPPTVVQFRKLPNGSFRMKTANYQMYEPQEEDLPPEVVEELIGDVDLTAQLESDGTLTASPDAAIKQTLDAEEIRVVDQPGIWKVQDKMGNTLTGWAFPQLLSFDLQPLPLTLFNNGSEFALQDKVAGSLISKGTDLPKARMQGYGCLYYLDHGTPRVFLPITIRNSYRGVDKLLHYTVVTDFGEQLDLAFCEGLKTVAKSGPDQYCLPESFAKWWMPLKSKTDLVSQPLNFTKYASKTPYTSYGELLGDSTSYSFRGEPFSKVASSKVTFLSRADAEFVGVAAGVHPGFIKEALDRAARGERVRFHGLKTLENPVEKVAAARAKVAKLVKECPVKNYFLVKEAAVLDDALTADKVLGLGFLNAENVNTFVEMLPGLEYALSKVAEMLMASRLGLKDIPEVALERMMFALEDVIQGLRTLQQREISYAEA